MGKFKYPLLILLTIIIGIVLTMWLCCGTCYSGDCNSEKITTISPDEGKEIIPDSSVIEKEMRFNGIELKDINDNLIEKSNNNLDFNVGDYKHIIPIASGLESSFDKIKNYLSSNEDKKLNITGLYTSIENNPSAFTNLGEARANDVKNYLTGLGFNSSKIGVSGLLNDDLVAMESIYKGPINYSLSDLPKGDDAATENKRLDDLVAQIKANPLVLHFATGSNQVQLTTAQRKKISDMNAYIGARPGARILITGHTDNVGNRNSNKVLSKKRAEEVKQYFVNNGIDASHIETTGKGPDVPIASNTTEDGKAQNRRVEVTLK